MSFLNLALLGGAAAFLVPLVIHLLNRSRHQSIDWGAMHLLEAAMQVNSRRFQWESVLLLMLRCLIPILFAIGLARPVLTSLRSADAQGEASVLVVVDDSLSMLEKVGQSSEQTRFERSVNDVRSILSSQRRADLSVWSSGGGTPINAVDGSTFDTGMALRSLSKIQPGTGPTEPLAMIETVVAQLEKMSHPNKQLIIASDFQASQWGNLSIAQKERVKELLQSASPPIQLTLLPAGTTTIAESTGNLSVELSAESLEKHLELVFVDDPVVISASIRNWGSSAVTSATVKFVVDEQAVASEVVSLQPNSQQQVQFACSFKTVGRHLFNVQLDLPENAAEQIVTDDIASGVIDVHDPVQILVVDASSGNRDDSVGRFLQLALSPTSGETSFKVQLSQRMPPENELKQCEVLVLIGSPFDDNFAKKIAAYVEQGGGLFLMASEGLDVGRMHRLWWEQNKLLPAKFLDRKSANASDVVRIKKQNYQDRVLSIFNSAEQGDLLAVQLQQWQPLQIQADSTPPTSTEVAFTKEVDSDSENVGESTTLMLEDDSVVLAMKKFGKGWVVQSGISPDPKWSNLANRPVYVPLMQRIVVALLGEGLQSPQQFSTGQMPTISLRSLFSDKRDTSVSNVNSKWDWIDPSGMNSAFSLASNVPATVADQIASPQSWNAPILRWPGVYRLKSSEGPATGSVRVVLAAGIPSHESDTKSMTKEQLEQMAQGIGATVVETAESFQGMQQIRRDGKEIWRPLVIVLLIFLFGEIFLARRVTRGG